MSEPREDPRRAGRPPSAWLRWPRSLGWTLALGVLVSLPSLSVGLMLDDLLHRLMLFGRIPGLAAWGTLNLYEFVGAPEPSSAAMREFGLIPWWSADALSIRFFRPLTSALLVLDTRLFGDAPFPAHLHSLAWFLGLVAVVGWLHQRLLPTPQAAVATAAYTLAAGHVMLLAWIAARHPLISGLFGMLALAVHLHAREDGWKPGVVLAPLLMLVGLMGGEPALGAVALIGAYEVLGRREGWRQAALRLAPYVLVVAGYLAFYVSRGYGAHGSAAYLDPTTRPGAFSVTLAQRILILLGELVTALPSDIVAPLLVLHPVFAAWGALTTVGALWALRALRKRLSERERHTLRWLLPGGFAAVIPGAVGVVGGRVLVFPLLAGSALVAVLLVRGREALREPGRQRRTRWVLRGVVAGLVLGHFVTGPLLRIYAGRRVGQLAAMAWNVARSAPPCDGTLILAASSDLTISHHVPMALMLLGRGPQHYRLLSAAPHAHRLERTSATGFDLVVLADTRRASFVEALYRDIAPPAGLEVRATGLLATVKESTEVGPMRVHFDFGLPLESPDLCFVTWRDGAIHPLDLPPPGGSVLIPYSPGLSRQ